jgi:hypothetical protein
VGLAGGESGGGGDEAAFAFGHRFAGGFEHGAGWILVSG